MRILILIGVLATCGTVLMLRQRESLAPGRDVSDVTDYGKSHAAAPTETATFAAGCFWKLEHAMRKVDGVVSTTAGYTGGTDDRANHAAVSGGTTGHTEAVRVVFDPARVSYERLLEVFWSSHEPMSFAHEPGEPPGPGRSAVFYYTEAQRAAAEASKQRLQSSGKYRAEIPTEILPASAFVRAEDEHQQFLDRHSSSTGACRLD
jgi:peptide-methionine (S)-S-oxide reductase